MKRLLVLDFDGTMTDAEIEGAPFRAGYLEDLAFLCGRELDTIRGLAEEYEAVVRANPNAHGWLYEGRIVAPAIVDPYLRIMPVARRILDHFRCFMDAKERARLLEGILYKYNYAKTAIAFRRGALQTLRVLKRIPTWIVTNSHTDPVRNKIKKLAEEGEDDFEWLLPRVHGSAKKYVVRDDFDKVPEALRIPGLSRPILLRRPHYYDVLARLVEHEGVDWEGLVVIGDIFELDLALPLSLGAGIGLVVNDFTPDYERAFVEKHPRGRLIRDLADIPAFLGL